MAKTSHPYRWLTATLLAASCMIPTGTYAQKYPQTADGSTVYYKILSACQDYEGEDLCLQDDSRTNKTYPYTLGKQDKEARNQEWVLVTANKEHETYHLRNRNSYRYISTETTWVGDFKVIGFATKQTDTNAMTITDLGDDQVAISYEDANGKRYLSATDVDKTQADMPTDLKNTQWAWKIYKATDLANGIHQACSPGVSIRVENRHIIVSGTDEWELADISGMQIPNNQALQPGHVYVVKAKGTQYKVLVK